MLTYGTAIEICQLAARLYGWQLANRHALALSVFSCNTRQIHVRCLQPSRGCAGDPDLAKCDLPAKEQIFNLSSVLNKSLGNSTFPTNLCGVHYMKKKCILSRYRFCNLHIILKKVFFASSYYIKALCLQVKYLWLITRVFNFQKTHRVRISTHHSTKPISIVIFN